jgi:hypothetical protein
LSLKNYFGDPQLSPVAYDVHRSPRNTSHQKGEPIMTRASFALRRAPLRRKVGGEARGMLREMAFVLHLTRAVKESLLAERGLETPHKIPGRPVPPRQLCVH